MIPQQEEADPAKPITDGAPLSGSGVKGIFTGDDESAPGLLSGPVIMVDAETAVPDGTDKVGRDQMQSVMRVRVDVCTPQGRGAAPAPERHLPSRTTA
jgi:hypothetical protein